MEFKEWFSTIQKEKLPELWDETFQIIDYYDYDYSRNITYLKENGDKYISFLEETIKHLYENISAMEE